MTSVQVTNIVIRKAYRKGVDRLYDVTVHVRTENSLGVIDLVVPLDEQPSLDDAAAGALKEIARWADSLRAAAIAMVPT